MKLRHLIALIYIGTAVFGAAAFSGVIAQGREGFVGYIEQSDRLKPGAILVFANINSAKPFVTWPDGNGAQTSKVFEDDELIVLLFVADRTGSTETFYLNKKRGRFTLVEVGALEATVRGTDFRPQVTYGRFRY